MRFERKSCKIIERRRSNSSILHRDASKILYHTEQLFRAFKAISNNFRKEEERNRVAEK